MSNSKIVNFLTYISDKNITRVENGLFHFSKKFKEGEVSVTHYDFTMGMYIFKERLTEHSKKVESNGYKEGDASPNIFEETLKTLSIKD